jgi:hypothetical protein
MRHEPREIAERIEGAVRDRMARLPSGAPGSLRMSMSRTGRSGRLMIVMEPQVPGRAARVVGSLTGDAVQMLQEAVDRGVTVLDLSEVEQVDDAAVQVLLRLSAKRCSLAACPRWLEMWLASAHRNASSPPERDAAEEPDGRSAE